MSIKNKLTISLVLSLLPMLSFAASTGSYVWEGYFQKIATSITGPVAWSITMAAIGISGIVMSFTDLQSGAKRLVTAALGGAIAAFAAQIMTTFIGMNGALI